MMRGASMIVLHIVTLIGLGLTVKLMDDVRLAEQVFIRCLVGLPAVYAYLRLTKQHRNLFKVQNKLPVTINSLAWLSMIMAFQTAAAHIPISLQMTIAGCSPIIVVMLTAVVGWEKISKLQVWGVLLGFTGLLATTVPELLQQGDITTQSTFTFGLTIAVLQAVFAALRVMTTRKISRSGEIAAATFWPLVCGLILFAPFGVPDPHTLAENAAPMALFAFLSVATFLTFNIGAKHINAAHIGALSYLAIPVSALLGYLTFNEIPSVFLSVGAPVILVGAFVATLKPDATTLTQNIRSDHRPTQPATLKEKHP